MQGEGFKARSGLVGDVNVLMNGVLLKPEEYSGEVFEQVGNSGRGGLKAD